MIDRIRKIGYLLAYAVATIPLWHYTLIGYMWIMATVVLFAYFMVVLSSVQASQTILSSEKSKITFPRWLPNKPKYQKWWSLSRHTVKWHLLLIIPKLGLALGFLRWFVNDGFVHGTYIFHELYYVGGYFDKNVPQIETIFIAICLITFFSIMDQQLITSIILLGQNIKLNQKKFVFVFTFRLLLAFSFMFLVFFTRIISADYYDDQVGNNCLAYRSYIRRGDTESAIQVQLSCYSRRVKETAYLALTTPFEQSILLSANVMRPIRPHPDSFWNWSDNRLFVARQVVAGLLGLILYAGTTWVILWFVEDEPEHIVT